MNHLPVGRSFDGMKALRLRRAGYPARGDRTPAAGAAERRRSTMEYIAFDAHKHYTLASVAQADGQLLREERIEHERGALQAFLARCEPGSPVALETVGNWYWIVDEIEAAGCQPKLVHARKAKLMMGQINKTDKLDARGLNLLQRTGTLPTVWIPPGELRDQRELPGRGWSSCGSAPGTRTGSTPRWPSTPCAVMR